MGCIDFLVNACVGLVLNSVVSGVVGVLTGVGVGIALHPLLIGVGAVAGGAAIAFARTVASEYERPSLTVIDGGLVDG